MDDQSVYINQLQEDLEAKLEQIEKLEDWLKVLVDNYCKHNKDEIAKEVASEIYHYIKAKEAK